MSSNPGLMIAYVAILALSLASIALAYARTGVWYRVVATAFSVPLSLYCAGYPGALLIPLAFPFMILRGVTLMHRGQRARGLIYCGPYLTLVILLIFFSFVFEPLFE